MMLNSLKVVSVGTSGVVVTWMEWLPVAVRVAVGLATLVYMVIKARNDSLMKE